MARDQAHTLLDPIRRLIGSEGGSALSDAELLEKFVATADATSFEVLVWRHGAMVIIQGYYYGKSISPFFRTIPWIPSFRRFTNGYEQLDSWWVLLDQAKA